MKRPCKSCLKWLRCASYCTDWEEWFKWKWEEVTAPFREIQEEREKRREKGDVKNA